MKHRASSDFWSDYRRLPASVRIAAVKQFAVLRANPFHPSLHFKKLMDSAGEEVWSARVNRRYRALAIRYADEYVWFWIGPHGVYDAMGD